MLNRYFCMSLALVGALFSIATPLAAQGPPPSLVETAPVTELEFHREVTLVGRSEARAESRIVAEVEGRVSSVNAAEGRPITRGAPLVTIDCQRLAFALAAKRAVAGQAAADSELAQKELVRAQSLVDTEVFPERNLDNAKATATRATERHLELEAEIKSLELDLDDCTIRAPYSGFTVRKLVDVGEWVAPGSPVFEMVDLATVRVTVDLPERYFGQLEIGSPARILLPASGAGDGETAAEEIEARVDGIAPRASEATHTFPVILEVDNRDRRLGGGMLLRATLILTGTFRGMAVSKDAVVRQDGNTLVYTVADGKALPVPVTVTGRHGAMVAVEAGGLEVGQEVVVRGNERIFPGSPVRFAAPDESGPNTEDAP